MTESELPQVGGVLAGADVAVHRPPLAADPDADPEEMITRLYADNRALVLSYVTGLLKDRYLAEDVVQETMLRAWRHCAQFSPDKGSVRGWLMKVAHNIAMDKIRMRRSRPAEVAEDAVPEALVTEDHADAVVTALQVRHALALLSPGHRDVLEQVYLNGCTAREAATRLGIPEGTAFSRAYYALRILRRELGAAPAGTGHGAASAAGTGHRAA
jgi:RNA polymerase sigma-70 factor (ECF subfamily)